MGLIDNKWALIQVMAWRRSGDKPLSTPMLTQFTDAYMWHSGEMSWTLSHPVYPINTFRSILNGRHFADDIFKCIYLNLINVWMKFFLRVEMTCQPLSDPMMTEHVTRSQWVNHAHNFVELLLWLYCHFFIGNDYNGHRIPCHRGRAMECLLRVLGMHSICLAVFFRVASRLDIVPSLGMPGRRLVARTVTQVTSLNGIARDNCTVPLN